MATRVSQRPLGPVDYVAGQRLAAMRAERGLSPEGLALDIRRRAQSAPWGERGTVDAHTIRKIERTGHIPTPRVRFVLAHYFDLVPHELWVPAERGGYL